jgi:hypothetical protein
LYKQSNQLDRPSGLLKVKVTITAEVTLKGEISTGLFPEGKAEISLKAGASVEIEIEGKDMADVSNKVVGWAAELAASLAKKLREDFRKLQRALDILDFLWRR